MTSSHHGLATVSEDLFEGSLAVVVEVHGEKLMMSDAEFRDLMRCAADLFPSMLPTRVPARIAAIAEPPVLELPMKPCGCGVLLGEVCDCASFAAQAESAFTNPLWGAR